jgi:hypothetical protein
MCRNTYDDSLLPVLSIDDVQLCSSFVLVAWWAHFCLGLSLSPARLTSTYTAELKYGILLGKLLGSSHLVGCVELLVAFGDTRRPEQPKT